MAMACIRGTYMDQIDGFMELLQKLLAGDVNGACMDMLAGVKAALLSSISENQEYLIALLSVAVLAAFFTNLTSAFGGGLLGEQGFYVSFVLIFTLAIKAFGVFFSVAEDVVRQILEVMQLLVPTYIVSVTGAAGSITGTAAYELICLVLTCIQYGVLYIMFPLLQTFFLFQFINQLNEEQYFTRWIALIKDLIGWGLKMITVFVVGMHLLKGMITPVLDSVKVGMVQKGINAIPGGSFVAAFTGVFLGCSILIKNSIGVAGILILLGIVAVPFVQMGVMVVSYYVLAALLEPILDKRLIKAMSGMAEAATLTFRTAFTSVVLLIVSIAMIASCTNMRWS